MSPRRLIPLAIVAAVVVSAAVVAHAKVRIRVQQDKTFTFQGLRTWAWSPSGAGDVKMALTPDDDPAAIRERFEPTIKQAVQDELAGRRLSMSPAGQTADLHVTYYILLSTNMSTQTLGQFVPSVPDWGLPPLSGATTSFKVIEQGSLVLDIASTASQRLVWRGVAQAEIDRQRSEPDRLARIQQAVRDLLKKLPST